MNFFIGIESGWTKTAFSFIVEDKNEVFIFEKGTGDLLKKS